MNISFIEERLRKLKKRRFDLQSKMKEVNERLKTIEIELKNIKNSTNSTMQVFSPRITFQDEKDRISYLEQEYSKLQEEKEELLERLKTLDEEDQSWNDIVSKLQDYEKNGLVYQKKYEELKRQKENLLNELNEKITKCLSSFYGARKICYQELNELNLYIKNMMKDHNK